MPMVNGQWVPYQPASDGTDQPPTTTGQPPTTWYPGQGSNRRSPAPSWYPGQGWTPRHAPPTPPAPPTPWAPGQTPPGPPTGWYPRRPTGNSPFRPPTPGDQPPGNQPPGGPDTGGQRFGRQLQQQWEDYQGPGQFNASGPPPGTFQPGANPFQTFTGSYTPQTAPGMRPTGQFTGGNPLDQQTQAAVSGFLANPNSFSTPQVQQSYNYLSQNIDDQFTQQQRALEEDMARRGLSASSIRGGRLSDLNVANRSAHEDLANQLLMQQGLTGATAQQNAINAALGYGGQTFGQQLGGYQANANTNQQNFTQALANAAFQGDQNAQALMQNMGIMGFNNAIGQQNFTNSLAGYNANLMGQNQGFNQQLAGYNANLGSQNQGFNQQQQLLANLLGYEQQGWQNQFNTAQFNAQQNQWYQDLLARMAQGG